MTISRPSAAGAMAGILLTVCALLQGCSRPPAEERLRSVINEMQGAVEAGQRRQFMAHVNENFSGESGQWDRAKLDQIMRVMMLRHKAIGTTVTDLDTRFFDNRATTTMKVLVTGGPSAWRPNNADFIEVTSGWLDSDEGWQLISAEWQ
ncbi:MAG: hypothetical protein AB8B96_05615 [Lysobacterales bacterium]